MLFEIARITFLSSTGVMFFIFILRLLELRLKFNLFKNFNPFVQKVVTRVSLFSLRYTNLLKQFLLVHMYHLSSETAKTLVKQSIERKESLLNKLGGKNPRSAEEMTDDNVSPFLKEISRIDRKEE